MGAERPFLAPADLPGDILYKDEFVDDPGLPAGSGKMILIRLAVMHNAMRSR